ncbi:MAG: hypothetical protein AAFV88_15875 [Planctomycetota bacterium]
MNSRNDLLETTQASAIAESTPVRRPGSVAVAPGTQLSRGSLIAAFAVMIGVGLGVYSFFPESIGGAPLPVSVTLGKAPVPSAIGNMAVLTEVVQVTNESDDEIRNLMIKVNGHYWMTQASPLSAGETLILPQEVFTDKRSSRRFAPAIQVVTDVTVSGQLPSKSRGISKFTFGDEEAGH